MIDPLLASASAPRFSATVFDILMINGLRKAIQAGLEYTVIIAVPTTSESENLNTPSNRVIRSFAYSLLLWCLHVPSIIQQHATMEESLCGWQRQIYRDEEMRVTNERSTTRSSAMLAKSLLAAIMMPLLHMWVQTTTSSVVTSTASSSQLQSPSRSRIVISRHTMANLARMAIACWELTDVMYLATFATGATPWASPIFHFCNAILTTRNTEVGGEQPVQQSPPPTVEGDSTVEEFRTFDDSARMAVQRRPMHPALFRKFLGAIMAIAKRTASVAPVLQLSTIGLVFLLRLAAALALTNTATTRTWENERNRIGHGERRVSLNSTLLRLYDGSHLIPLPKPALSLSKQGGTVMQSLDGPLAALPCGHVQNLRIILSAENAGMQQEGENGGSNDSEERRSGARQRLCERCKTNGVNTRYGIEDVRVLYESATS